MAGLETRRPLAAEGSALSARAHAARYELGGARSTQFVMDGTVMMGSEDFHAFMRHGADELAQSLPNARRRTLEGRTRPGE